MKSLITLAVAAVTAVALFGADVADAKRLGGGRSLGTQRQSIAPAPSTPAPSATTPSGAASNPVMPASPATAAAARPAAPTAAPAASGASRWLGPIAGIAAGLGLAALLSHFGLSETFASFLLIALVVIAAVVVVRMLLARKPAAQQASPLRYGAAGGASGAFSGSQRFQPANEITPPGAPTRIEPTWGGGGAVAAGSRRMPPDFNPAPFLEQAKIQFRRLQEAHDKGDRDALANVTTPAMYHEIARDLDARKAQIPTEIVALDAEILDVTQEGTRYVASIRFTGMLREDGARDAAPFVEVWNLEKPVNGSTGWLLAGIQQTEDTH